MKYFLLLFLTCFTFVYAQPPATPATELERGLLQKNEMRQQSLVKELPFTNIGPTIMSGRVVGFAVNPSNPTEFYVGYASGGVWHTTNNGTTFTPVLDNSATQNVGSLEMDWKTGTLWVGTGEVNASRSSYAGIGLLASKDNGKTWKSMGLTDSHHISSILINPENSNEVVVGAVGHLYSENKERGVYKTTDGGKTWNKTLFVNEQSGIIEIAVDPNNYHLMYASSWEKDRKAWNFKGSGEGSAIYKSTDAGDTWAKISMPNSGFPTGEGVGRIGIAVYDDTTIYAIVDNQNRRKEEKASEPHQDLRKDDFKTMTSSQFLQLEDKKLNQFLRQNGFQEKYKAENVKNLIKGGTVQPTDLAKYLEDANTMLFDTPVIGAEVYKSENGGKTWQKTHTEFLDDLYYSYGYYFGKIHVSPQDMKKIYIYGVPIIKSDDGGKTFTSINAENVHADHHALWINPKQPGHLIDGNDGGVNITYDDGASWIKNNAPAVGQFYSVNVDNATPYNVYGGLQDNGVWFGPHTHKEDKSWHQDGEYGYKSIMGGDGMHVQIDNRDHNLVYTGFQFGNYYRLHQKTGESVYIQPKHSLGENPYRFNWQTPILLSPHNQDILYLGGNKLMRSMNQGTDWEPISGDLTKGGKTGNVAYGTLTSISESPFQFGLLYTGSDDGQVYVSKDGGAQWALISENLPQDLWVSRVIASSHKKERVYVTLNGYRWDDFTPYVFVSEDYGSSWKNIGSTLPVGAVNVIKEDPSHENLVYIGTDNGAYVSFNKGENWEAFSKELPNVAVHDLVLQAEQKHLLLGTHGRSIYKANVALLQEMAKQQQQLILAEIAPLHSSRWWGSRYGQWGKINEPAVVLEVFSPQSGKATVSIQTEDGKVLQEFSTEVIKGVNTIEYDVTFSEKGKSILEKLEKKIEVSENKKYYLPEGTYTVKLTIGKSSVTKALVIK